MGERRRRREAERAHRPSEAAGLTRRQLREAERSREGEDRSREVRAPEDGAPEDGAREDGARGDGARGDGALRTGERYPAPHAQIVPSTPDRRRPRWLVPVLAGLVALVVLAVAAVAVLRPDDAAVPDAAPTATPATPATDRSLLLGIVDGAGDLTGTALLAAGADQTSALLVSSRLLVDVPSGGRVALRDALDTGDTAPAQAVGDALEVRVDGTWVLTTTGLAQLVDALGGVVVDVDVAIVAGDVSLAPGPAQTLTGVQAAAFATQLVEGEAEPGRLARLDQVLSGVLGLLPQDTAAVEQQLLALGGESRTTYALGDLAAVLADVADDVASDAYAATVLPVTEIASGAEEVLYGLDDEAASRVLADRFAGVQRDGTGQSPRVLVQNGVGTPGLGEEARNLLVEEGLRYVGGGNAETLGRATTVVAVPTDDAESRELGTQVAAALGLEPDVVAVGLDAPTLADVVVVLGADFAELVAAGTP